LSRFVFFASILTACLKIAQASTPVILISIDTLRADHLGCYQTGRAGTAHIDAFAKTGTLFSQVSSLVPLTLPSHVAMFTSTYPFENGVRDNGVPLGPGIATLATVFQGDGYRTAAFVGAFVLDRRFGLNHGFEIYDSPFDLHKKTATDVGDLKRPGAQIIAAAVQWLEHNSTSPFFLFVHLYDLHTPYDLPKDPRLRRGETGYNAELAEVDRVLGEFLKFLDRRELLKKTLVVLTSDHGEGLGDHGESTHGYFIYQSTLRVPLIIHWPSVESRIRQDRVDEPASVLDIAPTILAAAGLSRPKQMRGRSLFESRSGEGIYSESLYARDHFGCAALHSIRLGPYKYIDAPDPEFYNLTRDPGELQNIYRQQKEKANALRERLLTIRSKYESSRAAAVQPPETVSALRSLGYLSGSTSATRVASNIDPKDRIGDFEVFGRANALASAGEITESSRLLQELGRKLPDVTEIRVSLGLNWQRVRQFGKAADEFRSVIERDPFNAQAHFDLGISYFRLQQPERAVNELKAALAIEPWYTRAEELLATIYLQKHEYQTARVSLKQVLSVDPDNYTAHYDLGVLAAMQQNWTEAQDQVLRALQTDPDSAEAHNLLGNIYLNHGELDHARTEFERTLKIDPEFKAARSALDRLGNAH
jgi:arylsulfatase A-like enzyme/Tfp pilus assembly protein PilF